MKNKRLAGILGMLLLTLANFNRLKGNENIRAVQFLSILAIGILSGLLLSELLLMFRDKKDNTSNPV